MKYVLDANVAFKWAVIETDTVKARRLRDDYLNGVHELVAPDIFPIEIAHALTRAERQGRVTPTEGTQFFTEIMAAAPQFHAYLPLLSRAYAISSSMRVGVYDCVYVALAESENCELVTADDKLVKNLKATFPFIVSLASLP